MDNQVLTQAMIKQQLSEHGLLPREWGGDVIMVPVSAKQKQVLMTYLKISCS